MALSAFSPAEDQKIRNLSLLTSSRYMRERVDSEAIPFRVFIDGTEPFDAKSLRTLSAMEKFAARTAIKSVASLSKINEVDHMGGALGMLPSLLLTLGIVDYEKIDFTIENAHTSIGYYTALAAYGFLDEDSIIDTFRRGLDIAGHVSWVPGGTQLNGGRLGIMVPAAVGQALGKKAIYGKDAWVICHCGDAGWISGQALNGFNAADLHGAPVTFVMDRNHIQLSGATRGIMDKDPRPIIETMGVKIIETPNLYDQQGLLKAYRIARALAKKGRPSMIYPVGEESISLSDFSAGLGISDETSAFALANGVSFDREIAVSGSLMSYRDVEAMLECLFLINDLPGGKGHHDGHMKGRDLEKVLSNPMLRIEKDEESTLSELFADRSRKVVTESRPAPGAPNVVLSASAAKAVKLPEVGKSVSPRAGSQAAYAAIAEEHPDKMFVIGCDLDASTKLDKARTFLPPERQFEMSIQEQVSAVMANGLAVSTRDPQFIVFSTFAAFFEGIAREGFEMWRYQRNLNGINEGLNTAFHLSHVGACTGRDHFSGWALDWITLSLGYLPYLHRFYAPADARAAFVAVQDMAAHYGGHIIGIPRDVLPILEKQDGSGPLWEAGDKWKAVTEFRKFAGAKKAILAMGAPAFLADEASKQLNDDGSPVDVYIVNGLPLKENDLVELLRKYPAGVVTIEDGIISNPEEGLRGFAGLVSGVAAGSGIPLNHVGITDPRIAPAEGHMEIWEHFGITAGALIQAVSSL